MKSDNKKCPVCGGKKESGTTVYSVDIDDCLIVVRNVKAEICSQCGEEWFDDETARELEKITQSALDKRHQVEILAF